MSKYAMRFINNVLAAVVFVLAVFLIASPFLPELQLSLSQSLAPARDQAYTKNVDASSPLPQVPDENTLIIPDIGVHGTIHEGASVNTMNNGIWRRPHGSKPSSGGNTVLVAHRYLYTAGPDTFYHLPKVKKGQRLALYWDKKLYQYQVTEVRVVDPDAVEIEKSSKEPTLTLYTCTPLWTSEKRFVVTAKPVE